MIRKAYLKLQIFLINENRLVYFLREIHDNKKQTYSEQCNIQYYNIYYTVMLLIDV